MLLLPKLTATQLPFFAGSKFRMPCLDKPSLVFGKGDCAVDDQSPPVKPGKATVF